MVDPAGGREHDADDASSTSDPPAGAPDRRAAEARVALFLAACLLGGLAVGAALPADLPPPGLAVGALCIQTFITVGGLPRRSAAGSAGGSLRLLVSHHLAMTLPLIMAAMWLGLSTPLGMGVFLMAAAPPAAVTPAYAEVAGVDVRSVLGFCLLGYGSGLVITPALVLIVVGQVAGIGQILLTLLVGLILPTLAGRALHRHIRRVDLRVRRGVVGVCLFLVTFALGGGIGEGIVAGGLVAGDHLLLALLVIGRTFGTGWLATRITPTRHRQEAPFAGGFKNIALAAAVAGALVGPVAALPAILSFPGEVAYFLAIARRRRRPGRQPGS